MKDVVARAGRWGAPTVLLAFVVVGVLWQGVDALRLVAGAVAVLTMIGFGQRRPAWQMLAAALLATAAVALICHGASGNPGWFAAVTVVGWMAWIAAPAVWVTEYVAVIGLFVGELLSDADHGWLPWMAGTTFAVVACQFAQRERRLAEQLRAAQAGLAERARAEERNRIAHEIHDAVAHALTVSLLHISSARLAIDEDIEEARRLMAEAENMNRLALTEVRQTVGMLRQDGHIEDLLPDVGQIPRLVQTMRSAGPDVDLEIHGELEKLPNTTGVVLYRILQEALTNSVRHAPGARTRCRLLVGARDVRLTVDTDLATAPGPTGTGTGLASMRARAEVLGGTCTAGLDQNTWRVDVVLPLHALSGA